MAVGLCEGVVAVLGQGTAARMLMLVSGLAVNCEGKSEATAARVKRAEEGGVVQLQRSAEQQREARK